MDVDGINSTEAFLTLKKETLKTAHKNLSGDVDKAVAAASRVEFVVMNIQTLDCIALAINLLVNRDVGPDSMLLGTL